MNFYFAAKLLVVSGKDLDHNFVKTTEVIDLTNPSLACQPWVDHPTGIYVAAGAFVDNQVILCGGETPNNDYSTDCHLISPTIPVAIVSLNVGSTFSAAIEFQEKLLLSGGFEHDGGLSRTEFISRNQAYPGRDLPYPVGRHCLIKIGNDDFILTGGCDYNGNGYKQTWAYSILNGWSPGPEMIQERYDHGCSSFWLNENQIAVVSPGTKYRGQSVEFLILQQENPQWISGPDLPDGYEPSGGELVSNGDTLFYINTIENVFLQLICEESWEDCQWKILASHLRYGSRYGTFLTLIPDSLADCS